MASNLLNSFDLAQFCLATAQNLSEQNSKALKLSFDQSQILAALQADSNRNALRLSTLELLFDAKLKAYHDQLAKSEENIELIKVHVDGVSLKLFSRIDAIEQSCHRLRSEMDAALHRLDRMERSWPREFKVFTPTNHQK